MEKDIQPAMTTATASAAMAIHFLAFPLSPRFGAP
jgi:hypothetical protein